MIPPRTATASESGAQVDQISLQDCPAVIQMANLWGAPAATAPEPPEEPSPLPQSELASAPCSVETGVSAAQQHNFLSPDQIQQFIATAVQ